MLENPEEIHVFGFGNVPEDTNSSTDFEELGDHFESLLSEFTTDEYMTSIYTGSTVQIKGMGENVKIEEFYNILEDFEEKHNVNLQDKRVSKLDILYETDLSRDDCLDKIQEYENEGNLKITDKHLRLGLDDITISWFETGMVNVEYTIDESQTITENREELRSKAIQLLN